MSGRLNKIDTNADYFGIFDSFADAVMIIDSSIKILYANKSACKLFNCNSKSILNKSAGALLPGFKKTSLEKLKRAVKMDFKAEGKNSKTLYLELTVNEIKRSGKNLFVIFIRDTSSIKKLMEERDLFQKESEKYSQKLSSLLENTDVLLWSVKVDVDGELYYEQVNEAFASVTGRKTSDYNGKHLRELGPKEDYEAVLNSLNTAKERGVYIYEKEIYHRGKVKNFIIRIIAVPAKKGDSRHFIGSGTDITETKLAQKQILNERTKAGLYFDAAGVMLIVTDKNQTVRMVNKKGCDVLGYEEKEIVGKNWFDNFVPQNTREDLRKKFRNLIKGLSQPSEFFENSVQRKDNSVRYILWHNTVLKDDKGKITGILSSGEDITDRKQMEELLKLSEKKYRELARNAPIAVTRLDAVTDLYDFANEEFTRQTGYTIEEFNKLSKKEIYEMVYPDDRDALYVSFKRWVKDGYKGLFHHEYRITNKFKNLLWLEAYFYSEFDSEGKLIAVNQMYIDITERKRTEEKIRIFGYALESTTEMISITDLNNRFTYVNRAFRRKYGYREYEMLGKGVEILGSVKNPPDISKDVLKNTQKGGWEGELINTKKDGSEFPILLSTSPIKTKTGEVIGYVGVARDITELKNAYDLLRHSLKEKEILLKEVYHRVKNNMQVINSLLNIQSQSVTEPAAIELFRETQNRVKIMQLIHEKLYLSQNLSQIDFSLYIRDLTAQLRRAYPVSKNIELTINSEGVYLGVDRAIPCGLIINELVSNAYKYAFKDGRKGNIYIELTSEDDKYTLVVSDNGIGLPDSIDFRESDSLGMILICTLSDQLDGTVEIDRTGGTKFTIRF